MRKPPHIAVVAMDGIFPGASTLTRFWENIVAGIDQSAPVAPERWIAPAADRVASGPMPDRTYSRHACLVTDFRFDPGQFSLDKQVTGRLDPVHQLTLAAGKRALANCNTAAVDPMRVDTILAAIALPTDSASALARRTLGKAIERQLFPNAAASEPLTRTQALAGRVDGLPAALLAAEMGFGGECFTLDAACAASIYAVKLACNALAADRADMAVTGGVSRPECLYTQTGFSQLQALSRSGRCAPFDRRADGLVVGEGVGILVLKRLDDALAQGDTIHGVIHGIGVSNDMRGNLLAPQREGQVRAMQMAYRAAGWHPWDVDYIECHGTGTRAGDTTEIESLVQLWQDRPSTARGCAIGSVKSMIGHLLTAAGAAGMIKTLLAMRHATLPPSIHYTAPPPGSPLLDSPFRVQTTADPWPGRTPESPRRAAVSAFGFGGINAHILFEAWPPAASGGVSVPPAPTVVGESRPPAPDPAVAIVGLAVTAGSLADRTAFEKAVFQGNSAIGARPAQRWKGTDASLIDQLQGLDPAGAYMAHLPVEIGEFQIPPKQIADLLPQQLLALKVGAAALADTGLTPNEPHQRMGVVVGIEFDLEATNFHLRWQLFEAAARWNNVHGLNLDEPALAHWTERLRDQCGPPLTPPRVVGALGGIVASRMAREFRFGGPSFVVSAGAASGFAALRAAVDLLQQGSVDAMLVGAVDLAGEGRRVVRASRSMPLSPTGSVHPFDAAADGTLPGDGAVALVLKSASAARRDGDRIYAFIRGIGSAGGDDPLRGSVSAATYRRSLSRCFQGSGLVARDVGYVEAHGAGVPERDRLELNALAAYFGAGAASDLSAAAALGSLKPITGHTGAADSLMALAKTALCLHRRCLPPLVGFTRLPDTVPRDLPFHMPAAAQHWYRDRRDGPRTALSAAVALDSACSHVLLQEDERRGAAGNPAAAFVETPILLALSAHKTSELLDGIGALGDHFKRSGGSTTVAWAADRWQRTHPLQPTHGLAAALILNPGEPVDPVLGEARQAIESGAGDPFSRRVFYNRRPAGADARIAMVYPGSGNHYLGMGRDLALHFPAVMAGMDTDTARLKTQARPWSTMPWARSWPPGWEAAAVARFTADPLNMIFGQVLFGDLMTRVLKQFAIRTDAVIGYSLGESAALFAHGVWPDRGAMLRRMQATDLFTAQLAGPCLALRQAWRIPQHDPTDWQVAVVNRPAEQVREVIANYPHVRLLIVNTPDECVIGGLAPAVGGVIEALGAQAVRLEGVVTVHCDAARPVADAYRALHRFPTTLPPGLDVYSCGWGSRYAVTDDSVADSIEKQAVEGFDFTQTINNAHADGIRVFIEAGPRSSCTRMIDRILSNKPHLALAANRAGENEYQSLLRCLARLVAERIPVDLSPLYANGPATAAQPAHRRRSGQAEVTVIVGGPPLQPSLPEPSPTAARAEAAHGQSPGFPDPSSRPTPPPVPTATWPAADTLSTDGWERLIDTARQNVRLTADAHHRFLDLSQELTHAFADTFDLQNRLLRQGHGPEPESTPLAAPPTAASTPKSPQSPAFDRAMCLEFAVGSVGRVLGPAFAVVDTYPVRVRLPDDPLMLVDRILAVEGEMLSLAAGRVVTEHDVRPGAWYLDGGRAPVCISVEAGQADLFLCAFLGIDHQVKGQRAYRLLDAVVTFHRGLPRPGETIRYDIAIDRFVRQGDTWMFFFHFEGYIGDDHLISMRDGCAGFFTAAEVDHSGGILLTARERQPVDGKRPPDWKPPVAMAAESYTDDQVDALRRGDLAGCFGSQFTGIDLAESLHLPDGRMRLIHRIVELDPHGGRYGLGLIRAEADIHPDDWFLTCHFVDDMVMPGTLMYECCAHTLRVFLQRMGWVTDTPGVCYEPVVGNAARLKCRGPVTPATRRVHYEIQISEIGYGPQPYAVADAHMFADGRPIVFFKDMSLQMTGLDRAQIDALWKHRQVRPAAPPTGAPPDADAPLYDRAAILAFATGNPSEAFGRPYRVFDHERKIARLPGPPYCFMDRVIQVEPEPWQLAPGGWVTAQYDVPGAAWYFAADRSGVMPFCVLLEIALQPCGWLAAYAGSALHSRRDLKFRNLGGKAVLHRQVTADVGTLTMRCRMTKVSEAAEMIIENFDFEVLADGRPVYTGDTYFGFFSAEALDRQKGLGAADPMVKALAPFGTDWTDAVALEASFPHTPDDAEGLPLAVSDLALPAKALLMLDAIAVGRPGRGAADPAYIRGIKTVDPREWFFKAHFYQDPVCPGSLGLESFLQLLKIWAVERWPHLGASHRFRLATGRPHTWTYRGQVVPQNRTVVVEALITHLPDGSHPSLRADGLLSVDGLPIYKMENFELTLVPGDEDPRP